MMFVRLSCGVMRGRVFQSRKSPCVGYDTTGRQSKQFGTTGVWKVEEPLAFKQRATRAKRAVSAVRMLRNRSFARSNKISGVFAIRCTV